MTNNLESTDLAALARHLQRVYEGISVEGFVVGRTRLRDATAEHLGCSQAEAERLVETLIVRNLVEFERDPEGGPGAWRITPPPAAR